MIPNKIVARWYSQNEDFKGNKPIHNVCYYGNVEMMNLLLDKVNLEEKRWFY